jgi:hypothetical protein
LRRSSSASIAVVLAISSGLVQVSAPANLRARLTESAMVIAPGRQRLVSLGPRTTAQAIVTGPAMVRNGVTLLLVRPSIRDDDSSFQQTLASDPGDRR